MICNVYVQSEAELAGLLPRQLTHKAAKHVQSWREFAVAREERIKPPTTVGGQYGISDKPKMRLSRGGGHACARFLFVFIMFSIWMMIKKHFIENSGVHIFLD